MATKQKRIERKIDNDNGTVSFTVVKTGEQLVVKTSDFPENIQRNLMLHGINAKIGDAAASPESGMADMQSVYDALKNGDWSTRSGGGGGPRVTQLAEALSAVTGKTVEEAVEYLGSIDDDEKKALRDHAQIKAALTEIKAKKAAEDAKKAKANAKDAAPLEIG